MSFKVMYYVTIACPTVARTLSMIDRYIENGVDSLQIDMPSTDPFGETDFIKAMMKQSLEGVLNYDIFMGAIRKVRKKYPQVSISIVVYPDVVEAIGEGAFIRFLKEIDAQNNVIAGGDLPLRALLGENGITCTQFISYSDPEYDIERLKKLELGKDTIITMRSRRKTDALNRKYDTWEERVCLVRGNGIQASLYAVADVTTKADMLERKNAGMDGVIVGNSLMRLWDDEPKFLQLLSDFQSTVE